MTRRYAFTVLGKPVPKQSFRMGKDHGYPNPRAVAWEHQVAAVAREAMRGETPITTAVKVTLNFWLPDRRKRDCDNLSKGVLDALRGIVFADDCQVVDLHITKSVAFETGVYIHVEEII